MFGIQMCTPPAKILGEAQLQAARGHQLLLPIGAPEAHWREVGEETAQEP